MDQLHVPPYLGAAGRRLYSQMAAVLDPFAARHGGEPAELVRSGLRRVWCAAFAAEMGEPTLSRCARAIADRRPWQTIIWSDDNARVPHPVVGADPG